MVREVEMCRLSRSGEKARSSGAEREGWEKNMTKGYVTIVQRLGQYLTVLEVLVLRHVIKNESEF